MRFHYFDPKPVEDIFMGIQKIQHRSLNLILLGMGLLTNAGPQPWHPGRKITNLYIDDINDNEEDNQIQFNLESL